jgi:NADH:ubiquinone oxidoreductase subunit F (NADH-binding)
MKERTNTTYFYFAPPGAATVQVQVWGTIPQPGIYEVADSTSLDKLLSMAGGAPTGSRTEGLDPPEITVRVYRPDGSGRSLLFESRIEKILSGERQFRNLRDDAIVVVETTQQRNFTWRDALSVSSTALSLTLLVLRILEFRN